MQYLLYLAAGYATIASALWMLGFGFILRQLFSAPRISRVDAPTPDSFPALSVLVPARNEADAIEPALRSLLSQDYPNLEVIAIDDRSTDETGTVMERLSDEYERLRVLHIETLPDGWMGKTHALKQGYAQTTGDWVLMTDADVCYEPGALRSIMAVALHDDLDQLSCLPHMQNSGFLHEVTYDGWVTLVMGSLNLRGVRDRKSDDYFAFGAFNMVRRDVFDRTKGFSWLRMDIADDMATAKMMKAHGAWQGFYLAPDQLTLAWYPSFGKMMSGLEKNGIAVVAHYKYWKGGPSARLEPGLLRSRRRAAYALDACASRLVERRSSQHSVQRGERAASSPPDLDLPVLSARRVVHDVRASPLDLRLCPARGRRVGGHGVSRRPASKTPAR